MSRAPYERKTSPTSFPIQLFAYEANCNNIEAIHLQSGAQSPTYKEWMLERDSAIGNFALAHAVLAKYQLSGLRAAPHPAPEPVSTPVVKPTTPAYDPTPFTAPRRRFVSEHTAFFLLLPVAFLSWVLMYFAASFLLGRAGEKSLSGNPPQPELSNDWPPLPDALRTAHLPG